MISFSWHQRAKDAATTDLLLQHLSRKDKGEQLPVHTLISDNLQRQGHFNAFAYTLQILPHTFGQILDFFPKRKIPVATWSTTVLRQVQKLEVSLTRVHLLELWFSLAITRTLSCKSFPGSDYRGITGVFTGVAQPPGRQPAGRADPI